MKSTRQIFIALLTIGVGFAGCKSTSSATQSVLPENVSSNESNVARAKKLLDGLVVGKCTFKVTIPTGKPDKFQVDIYENGKFSKFMDLRERVDEKSSYPIFGENNITYGPSNGLETLSNYNLLTLTFKTAEINGPLLSRWIEVWYPIGGGPATDAVVSIRRTAPGGFPIGSTKELICKN